MTIGFRESIIIDSTSSALFSTTKLWFQGSSTFGTNKQSIIIDSTSSALFSTTKLWFQSTSGFAANKLSLIKSVVKGHPTRKY